MEKIPPFKPHTKEEYPPIKTYKETCFKLPFINGIQEPFVFIYTPRGLNGISRSYPDLYINGWLFNEYYFNWAKHIPKDENENQSIH